MCGAQGFGLAMGAEVYHQVSGSTVSGNSDYSCVASHLPTNPWWRRTPSPYWGKQLQLSGAHSNATDSISLYPHVCTIRDP
jgi:hypothetical protein